MCSAMATAASLPEQSSSPYSSVSSVSFSPTFRYMEEPSVYAASRQTVTTSFRSPSSDSHQGRQNLGSAGDQHFRVGVLLIQHPAAVHVHQNGGGGRRTDRVRLTRKKTEQGRQSDPQSGKPPEQGLQMPSPHLFGDGSIPRSDGFFFFLLVEIFFHFVHQIRHHLHHPVQRGHGRHRHRQHPGRSRPGSPGTPQARSSRLRRCRRRSPWAGSCRSRRRRSRSP